MTKDLLAQGRDAPAGRAAIASGELPENVRQAVQDETRLSVLDRLDTVQRFDDPDFERLTRLAARLFDAPIAVVSLLGAERQWFQSGIGVDKQSIDVDQSFCSYTLAVAAGGVMTIEDALADARFAGNPYVAGPPHIRFYAGAPVTVDGERIGTLSVLDTKPRPRPSVAERDDLVGLAALASSLFAFKDGMRRAELADAALAREEKRHALALDAASIASWVWDLRTGMLECDPLMTELFGLPEATLLPVGDILAAIDPRDVAIVQTRLNEALATGDDYAGEYRVRNVDPPRWLAARGRVIERDAEGKPTLVFGVSFDISESKLGQDRQRLLLRELNHRVKNTLATVQALATQTVRHSREPREFLDAFNGRLQALGLAHNLLSDHEWRGISLRELIRMQVLPLVGDDRARIVVTGEEAHLSPDQAVALGMILHELATNAVKYGSLSTPDGKVDLGWSIEREDEGRVMRLHWIESGGPRVEPPTRKGFGSILIERSLGKVLSSRIRHEFLPGGVRASMSMTLDEHQQPD